MFGETGGTVLVSGTSTSGYLIKRVNQTTGVTENDSTRVFHVTLISGTGTASTLQIYNGSAATIPTIIVTGTSGSSIANRSVDSDYGVFGQSFPLGAYYVTDSNLSQAAIVCKADKI